MANNYLQFSEQIEKITPEEAEWIRDHLDPVAHDADEDTPEYDKLAEFYDFKGTGSVCIAFEWSFERDHDTDELVFWVYAEDYGDIDQIVKLVQAFLKKWRPDDCFTLTWAATCDKLRIGEFEGGAAFVTAEQSHYISASSWADRKVTEWNKAKKKRAS